MAKATRRRQRRATDKRLTVAVPEECSTPPAGGERPAARYASGGLDAAAEFSVAEARWRDVAPDLPADLACWVAPPIVVSVRAGS